MPPSSFLRPLPPIVGTMRSWLVVPVSVVGGVVAFGCSRTPAVTPSSQPRTLVAHVDSVSATLEPYNPQISNHGIPSEQVSFTVSGLPESSTGSYLHCTVALSHSGRQVGSTSVVTGATPMQLVSVEVTGDNIAGKPSDAQVVCHDSSSPIGK